VPTKRRRQHHFHPGTAAIELDTAAAEWCWSHDQGWQERLQGHCHHGTAAAVGHGTAAAECCMNEMLLYPWHFVMDRDPVTVCRSCAFSTQPMWRRVVDSSGGGE
jgi:hypothetical protein